MRVCIANSLLYTRYLRVNLYVSVSLCSLSASVYFCMERYNLKFQCALIFSLYKILYVHIPELYFGSYYSCACAVFIFLVCWKVACSFCVRVV